MELQTRSVSKIYDKGKIKALDNFTMDFEPGIYGLLGPNGAGKSTFMNILTANLKADSGDILWNGTDIRKAGKSYRSVLGYMPQQQSLYDDFTGDEDNNLSEEWKRIEPELSDVYLYYEKENR